MSSEVNKDNIIREWVASYSESLYLWAVQKTSSKETAEDLVQDTFLSAVKSYDSFKGKSSPKTWLFRILNNKIIDYYRKASRSKHQALDELKASKVADGFFLDDGHLSSFEEGLVWEEEETALLDNPEFQKVLAHCLSGLPERWHFAITAKYLLEKNATEICNELNITASNYWQIIRRTKLLLRNCLTKNWG